MSLDLNCGTTPDHTRVKTSNHGARGITLTHEVERSSVNISMIDFCDLAKYVLTNTDLIDADPRLALVEFCKSLVSVEGWNGKESNRLEVKK